MDEFEASLSLSIASSREKRLGEQPLRIAVVEALQESAPNWIPADRLAELAETDSAGLHHELVRLEHFGFAIERHPHYGLRYAGPARRLCPDQIEWQLNTRLIGRRIAVWNRVTSTNDLALRAAVSQANEGLAVFAEQQTHGRGRRGRQWLAPPATGLLLSVLLFPPPPLGDPLLLTSLSVVAVCDTLEQLLGVKPVIKWPNDLLVGGKKVCGILVERGAGWRGRLARPMAPADSQDLSRRRRALAKRPYHASGVVLGIGLNCNGSSEHFPPDLRETATTLAELTGTPIDRSHLARRLLQTLDTAYHELSVAGSESLWSRWTERAGLVGATVDIELAHDRFAGVVRNIDSAGTVQIETLDGSSRAVRLQHVLRLNRTEPHRA